MQSRNVIIKRKFTFCVINFIIQTEISLAEPNDERTSWKRERDGKHNTDGKRKKDGKSKRDGKRDRDRNQIDSAQICNANKSSESYKKMGNYTIYASKRS